MSQDGTPYPEHDPLLPRKPAWNTWKLNSSVRLWEAVALACNLEPGQFTFKSPQLNRLFQPQPHFEELLMMAKSNIANSGLLKPISLSKEGVEESEVKLSNFATWLNSIGYSTPAEFPWQPEAMPFSNMNWPWGRHETELLRKLAAAADRFWKNYDPSDPTTAPTNQQVIDWLKDQDVSVRNAEVIATILRADGLSTGPRK